MVIHLATDHAGFPYKEEVGVWLAEEGFEVIDHGAYQEDPYDDFPDFIGSAAAAVSEYPEDARGIIFGGSGQGEAMAANRFPGVRAVVYYGGDELIPRLSREHNDSNVLSIGARFVPIDAVKRVVWDWLHTPASTDGKYARRNEKLDQLIVYDA